MTQMTINWANRAGATTVLVGSATGNECEPDLVIASLAELPRAIEPSSSGFAP